jgi:DNA-binding LacI/PurR family transcriptional regulator
MIRNEDPSRSNRQVFIGDFFQRVNVPEDISIVGFDNIDMCEKVNPKLTTVNVDKGALGKRAVQRLRYQIEHPDAIPENTVISVKLVERQSVKGIHAAAGGPLPAPEK